MISNTQSAPDAQWYELTGGRPFVLDLGFAPGDFRSPSSGKVESLARYAAFMPIPKQRKHQIVEISADQKYLQNKYAIGDDLVIAVAATASQE